MAKNFVVETIAAAPVQRVWKAITDPGQMKQWYFDITGFGITPGTEFSFYGGTEDKPYLHLCKITEVIPGEKLSYTWQYENIPVVTLVSFELKSLDPNKTHIKLTHEGIDQFPADNPDLTVANFEEGWTFLIQTALKNHVESKQANNENS